MYQPNTSPTIYGGAGAAGMPSVTGNATYYAYYYISYRNYEVAFGDTTSRYLYYGDQTAHYGDTYTVPNVDATIVDAATGETLTFVGWRRDDGTLYAPGSVPNKVTGNMVFTAVYE